MVVVTGRIVIKETSLPAVLAAARKVVPPTLAETGCAAYSFSTDIDAPLVLHLFEQWDSGDALDAHFATPHFQEFSEVLVAAAEGAAEFNRYEATSVSPLFG